MECGELMPDSLVFHEASAPIASVVRSMSENQAIPIVENSGNMRLVGILTDQDIVGRLVAFCRDPKTTPAHEIMTADPVTCNPSDKIEDALSLMKKCRVSWIPIVNSEKRLLGIIKQSDIAAKLNGVTCAPVEVLSNLSEVDAM